MLARPRSPVRVLVLILLSTLSIGGPGGALARASSDASGLDGPLSLERLDLTDDLPQGAESLLFSLQAGMRAESAPHRRHAFTAMAFVTLPLDRLLAARLPRLAQAPTLKPALSPRRLEPEPAREDDAAEPPPAYAPSLPVTPEVARDAVAAALRRAGLSAPGSRADALASRARSSALLPVLRLRAAHLADEGRRLAPTAYDPERITASDGTRIWLDARTTWRLDRLVFASEEIALERIRNERMEARTRLVQKVLEALFAWQRALVREADPSRTAEERLVALLAVVETEATLDLLTDGWFTRWREVAR